MDSIFYFVEIKFY